LLLGVISDTHLPSAAATLPREIFDAFEGVDLILHAGDLVNRGALDQLEKIAPVEAVAGNMDPPELRRLLPFKKIVEAGRHRIGLIHGWGSLASPPEKLLSQFPGVSAVVFGHTHDPLLRWEGSVLLLNPGSPAGRSGSGGRSVARLTVGEKITGEIVYL
jgi:putative phosphoesterase